MSSRRHYVAGTSYYVVGTIYVCVKSFLEVNILTTTYQKAFILGPYVPCEVGFPFMPSDHRVHARGKGLQGQNPVHVQNLVFLG